MPVKLSKAISWLVQGLQQVLFPELEEWWQSPLTEKEQQLISILELVRVGLHFQNILQQSKFLAFFQWVGIS
jgi:hypothetical protein